MVSPNPRAHPDAARRVRGLYAIVDSAMLADESRLLDTARMALAGGARVMQYRDKSGDAARRRRQARALAALCRAAGVVFIVNDDVALAATAGADGVHLGRDDGTVADARKALGRHAIIGVSCYNELERARAAQDAGADYVAFGRFFASRSKPHAVPATVELLRAARAVLHVPIVAIGGITPDNGGALLAAGADALAAIDGVFGASDVRAAAARYAALFV